MANSAAARERRFSYRVWMADPTHKDGGYYYNPRYQNHGSASGYSNWGCRCGQCNAFNTNHLRQVREAKKERRRGSSHIENI